MPERYTDATPIDWVRDNLPPLLIIEAKNDTIVPTHHGDKITKRLAVTNTPYVHIRLPWARHGFDAVTLDWAHNWRNIIWIAFWPAPSLWSKPDACHAQRPTYAQRPANGLLAWEATIGYLRLQYRLDARLTLQAVANANMVMWNAYAVWGQNTEQVTGKLSMQAALRDLWSLVDRKHVIFESREAMLRRPSNYKDDEWLDSATHTIFSPNARSVPYCFYQYVDIDHYLRAS